jgi:RNA-splicing ligase RtcB
MIWQPRASSSAVRPRAVSFRKRPVPYKDIGAVVDAAHNAGLARKVAMVAPVICIKG